MSKLIEIGSFMTESQQYANRVAEVLENAGFEIRYYDGYPILFGVCESVESE